MSVDPELDRAFGGGRATRVRWLLALLAGEARSTDPLTVADLLGPLMPRPLPFLHILAFWGQRLAGFEVAAAQCDADDMLVVGLRDPKGRPWMLRCRVGAAVPHVLEFYAIVRPLPDGVTVRAATEADAEALATLERACPIERSDGSRVALVRGRSIFDQLRFASWSKLLLAEERDTIVACYANAIHRARIADRDVDLVYVFHTRVLPSHRRLGLNETLMMRLSEERFREGVRADGLYVYVDPGNEVIREWSPASPWKTRPLRALLHCPTVAGPEVGRLATPGDAAHIAALVNAAHRHQELFRPYDVEAVGGRLGRVPNRYGFGDLRMTTDAVVGVWSDREERILEQGETRETTLRDTVLDWGFAGTAGLASFEALLRAACGRLAAVGVTHLSVFFADTSPAASLLRSLAESVVEVELRCTLPEPADAAARGVAVDAAFF